METQPEGPTPRRKVSRVTLAAVLTLALAATMLARPGAQEEVAAATAPPGFTANAVATGLNMPSQMAFSPDGKVYVAEKGGTIRVFPSASAGTSTLFANLSNQVFNNWDRGLLGIAVDPRFEDGVHRYVYVLYAKNGNLLPGGAVPRWKNDVCPTPPGGETDGCVVMGTLSRIKVNADGSAGAEEKLIDDEWCQQYTSHSVGALHFGSDGYLYVTGGEGASWSNADWGQWGGSMPKTPTPKNPCNDPGEPHEETTTGRGGALRSQSPRRPAGEPRLLSGSLLRVDPDTGFGVPGNPMYNPARPSANESRILAYGMRNPFRFTERPGTGEMWIGDVGQSTWEEINRVPANPATAPNFGWPCYEGPDERGGYSDVDMCKALYEDTSDPATPAWFRYEHGEPMNSKDNCVNEHGSSVSGLAFYEGDRYPSSYKGSLFVADSSRACIWVMSKGANGLPDPTTARTFISTGGAELPVDLKVDPRSGDIFYVSIAQPNEDGHLQANTGSIHRIASTSDNRAPSAVATATPTSGTAPLKVTLDGRGSSDPDGDPLTYSWDIDGNVLQSTSATTTWTFTTGGTYNVRLTVSDPDGLSSTSNAVTVTVSSPGPVNTSLPTVIGTPSSSRTLTGRDGSWNPTTGYSTVRQWQRCASSNPASCADILGATGEKYVVQETDEGSRIRLRVTATNRDGSNTEYSDMTNVVTDGNSPPVPAILSPSNGVRWQSGDRIEFEGAATDPEQGDAIDASGYEWTMVTGHCPTEDSCHTHGLHHASGVKSGTFFAEDHLAPSFISITLSVTDNAGNRKTTTVRIEPYEAELTAQTSPEGLTVGMGDERKTGGYSQRWVSNSQVQLTAPAQQTVGGKTYYFSHWTHGGAATQVVKVPRSDTTYTANYTTNGNPFGRFEERSAPGSGRLAVRGWAIDRSAPTSPTDVYVVIGGARGEKGTEFHTVRANRRRDDIASLHPHAGPNHGFERVIDTKLRGTQKVCTYANNIGPGPDTLLGCTVVDIVK
jgi:glucose/arabinose dehydrogenase/PKD repeat protein